MDIARFRHEDDGLWTLIGRAFADTAVRRALGGPLSSDAGHTWWVASRDGAVLGFAAMRRVRGRPELRHAWVYPAHRRAGVYGALLAARLAHAALCGDRTIDACCTDMSRAALMAAGFVETGRRGKYFMVSRDDMLAFRQAA